MQTFKVTVSIPVEVPSSNGEEIRVKNEKWTAIVTAVNMTDVEAKLAQYFENEMYKGDNKVLSVTEIKNFLTFIP